MTQFTPRSAGNVWKLDTDGRQRRSVTVDTGRCHDVRRSIARHAGRASRLIAVIGVVAVVLMGSACRTTKRSSTVGPITTRDNTSAALSPADRLILREAAEMAASDQERASRATKNTEPAVLYRDPPLRPMPFP